MTQSLLFAGCLVLAGLLGTACVNISAGSGRFVEREEKRFTVEGKPDVRLRTGDGSIQIRTWDRPDVLVVIEKHAMSKQAADAIVVASSQDANHISLEVKPPVDQVFGWFLGGFGSANLVVSIPSASDVTAVTGDGSIQLDGVRGVVSLRSGDGSIQVRDVSGSIEARSGDGSIRLEDISGAADANTGDGSIGVAGVLSKVRARSGDGSIGIRAKAGSKTDGDWEIVSGDGGVRVDLPERFDAELDARTGDGGVQIDGITLSNVTSSGSRNRAAGRLGDGGRALRVRTGDGAIVVRQVSGQ